MESRESGELLELGFAFHGHKCPAMPLGLRAGVAAMEALGVARSQDKELQLVSETGKGHAAGCFLDGIMVATGCTYGKSNIEKLYYDKMAFTLIDVKAGKAVRVSLRPEFFAKMLTSPFVEERKRGIPPQDISPEIADPLVAKVMSMPRQNFLVVGPVEERAYSRKGGVFEVGTCARCGELAFVSKLVDEGGERVCLGCRDEAGEEG